MSNLTLVRSPQRVSLFGGGSDRQEYYEKRGPGAVFSFAINKYVHVVVNRVNNNAIKLMYSKIEYVTDPNELQHDIVREVWKYFNLGVGWEIGVFADIPTVGAGLGGSSAFTCALLRALSAIGAIPTIRGPIQLAELACFVEINLCKSPIGKQDQYASAHGGWNIWEFHTNGTVYLGDGCHGNGDYQDFLDHCLLFYTGISHKTNDILSQSKFDERELKIIDRFVDQVWEADEYFGKGDWESVGHLLDEAWQLKRQLPGVTNNTIDTIYNTTKEMGAWGGKVLGSGGGGYVLIAAPMDRHEDIQNALLPLKEEVFHYTWDGTSNLTSYDYWNSL